MYYIILFLSAQVFVLDFHDACFKIPLVIIDFFADTYFFLRNQTSFFQKGLHFSTAYAIIVTNYDFLEGCIVAKQKRNRYREMESLMSKILIGDAVVFILFLLCAAKAWTVMKVATAIITIFGSFLCLGWLYLTGEFPRRRSLWMITGFAAIALCVIASLLLNFPCPAPVVSIG